MTGEDTFYDRDRKLTVTIKSTSMLGTEFVDISFTWHSLGHIPPFSVRKGVSAAWPTIPNVPGAQAIIRAPDMLRANE